MTWVPDQHRSCMVGYGEDVRAIGWLGNGRPYPTGKMGFELQGLLDSHIRTAWAPVRLRGLHDCDLDGCPAPARDSRNLWVPTQEVVYIAPAMVSHYVKVHSYLPPNDFLEALLSCPRQGSSAYHDLMDRFLDPLDALHFDRLWKPKREAEAHRRNQWVRRGMCARCKTWHYLLEGQVAEHCGTALVSLEDRDPSELVRARSAPSS